MWPGSFSVRVGAPKTLQKIGRCRGCWRPAFTCARASRSMHCASVPATDDGIHPGEHFICPCARGCSVLHICIRCRWKSFPEAACERIACCALAKLALNKRIYTYHGTYGHAWGGLLTCVCYMDRVHGYGCSVRPQPCWRIDCASAPIDHAPSKY